jgi:hypothetical protein
MTAKKIREKLKDRIDELNRLRADCKSLWDQIKKLNDDRASTWQVLKTAAATIDRKVRNKTLTDLKAQLQPNRDLVQKFQAEVRSLRALKEAEWAKFRAAVKNKNIEQATAAFNAIIKFKSQIIEKQKEIIPVKQKIVDILKDTLDAINKLPKVTPKPKPTSVPTPAATPVPTLAPTPTP